MIIFFYGEDIFRSRQKVKEIKQKYLNSDKSGSGLSVFDCDHASSAGSADKNITKNIISVMTTPNLLAPKRLLIVKDFISSVLAEEQKEMLNFFKKKEKELSEEQDTVVVFLESGAPRKNNAFYKLLLRVAKSQNFEKLLGIKLESWILSEFKKINPSSQISEDALRKLILYCGENSFTLFSEIEKLANYASGEKIEEKDIERLVTANLGGNVFPMVDALGKNDKKEALNLLHQHLEKGDDPFYLMSMFFYQFRNMLKVADLKEQGMPEYEIARVAKLHPFVVKKSLAQISRLPFSKLKIIYQKLGELDAAVKTGKLEIKLALDKFVVEM